MDSCPVRSAAGWEGGAIITTRLGRCRSANLLDSPVGSLPLTEVLNWWESSERRRAVRSRLSDAGVDPSRVIMGPDAARSASLTSAAVFPVGNLAPEGSVIKATAIGSSVVDGDVYCHEGPVKVFVDERDAVEAVKGVGSDLSSRATS